MQIIFVHGWSVTHTDTYGGLPEALAAAAAQVGLAVDVQHIHLGRYVSFHDEVTLDDIARGLDAALRDLPGNEAAIQPFSCITHSTGGPVVRTWLDRYFGVANLAAAPLRHLVMLAPANHGSPLATLGKERVGRIEAWWKGVEPGQRVLDWLCLGSDGQWLLNERCLAYSCADAGVYPFVLTGQGIDDKLYDFLNSYLTEKGSDGVVRVCGANLDYQFVRLTQDPETEQLALQDSTRHSATTPLRVFPQYSHSGKRMGIMRSVAQDDLQAPVVQAIVTCLQVDSEVAHAQCQADFAQASASAQSGADTFCMLVFSVRDNQGNRLRRDDYDLFLLSGNAYRPDRLPKGFFKDRQMNEDSGRLVYYLNADKMAELPDGRFGISIEARPDTGFAYYRTATFKSEGIPASSVFRKNETTYVDIVLHRYVDQEVFRFDSAQDKPRSFKAVKPSGKRVR